MATQYFTAEQIQEQRERLFNIEIYLKELKEVGFYRKNDSEPETVGPLFARESLALLHDVCEFLETMHEQTKAGFSNA